MNLLATALFYLWFEHITSWLHVLFCGMSPAHDLDVTPLSVAWLFNGVVICYNHIWAHYGEKANASLTLSSYNANESAGANNDSVAEIIKSKGD